MEAICTALVATYLSGVQPAQLNKATVYEIPASALMQLTATERATARTCAQRLGIRYRIVKTQSTVAGLD